MQIMSWPRWFRIVSTQIAVFPVERSPMISSRWPRPIGIIESIALMPVCSGSFTGWRSTTPGALNSSGRVCLVSSGGPPSMGLPSGSTMRPISSSPTGMLATRPVRRTGWPSLISCQSPNSAAPTLSSSRLKARPVTPCSSSSISIETAFEPVDAGDAVADLEDGADLGQVGLDGVLLDPLLEDRRDLFRA